MPRNETRVITLAQARAQYVHRYTMEHIPAWARKPCEGNGKYYAPQFRTDKEWYDNATFPGEGDIHRNADHCESSGQTWPLGHWLDAPYTREAQPMPYRAPLIPLQSDAKPSNSLVPKAWPF